MNKRSKKFTNIIKAISIVLSVAALKHGCYLATDGFSHQKILSRSQSNDITSEISEEKAALVKAIFDQPFHYLARGKSFYCFISEDQNYVVKFFKQQRLEESKWLTHFPLPSQFNHLKNRFLTFRANKHGHRRKEFLFNSIKIASEQMAKETGLIHAQLSRSSSLDKQITFFDKIGVIHTMNLKDTEFVIQKRATLFYPYLKECLDQQNLGKAKTAIDHFVEHIKNRCQKGIMDIDIHPFSNYGFVDGEAVELDIGSYTKPESCNKDALALKDLTKILEYMSRKFKVFECEELASYSEEKLHQIKEDQEISKTL